MSGTTVREHLCRCVRERATGAVEWRHDKRRRLFFFDAGELVLVQSNLKSESTERIGAKNPELQVDALLRYAALLRVAATLAEPEGSVTWYAGTAAPSREPLDVLDALWAAVDRFPLPPSDAFPRSVPASAQLLARLPVPEVVRDYLLAMDGTRPLEDVADFAPADPETILHALAIAAEVGAVNLGGSEASNATVVPEEAPKPVAAPRSGPAEIADLIRDEIATERGAPSIDAPARQPVPTGVDMVAVRFGPLLDRVRNAPDHFAALGVNWDDAADTQRKSYFALARELHPDRFVGDPPEIQAVAAELFDRVREAWEVLGDDATRAAYIAKVVRGEKTEDEKAMDKVQSILSAENDFRRGMAEFNGGRVTVAHDLFVRASAAMPEELEFGAYAGYTTFKLQSGRDEAAAEAGAARIRAALEANEKLDGVWVLMGLVHRARGHEDAARKAFVSALKLKPSNPDAAREMRRLDREKDAAPPPAEAGKGLSLSGAGSAKTLGAGALLLGSVAFFVWQYLYG